MLPQPHRSWLTWATAARANLAGAVTLTDSDWKELWTRAVERENHWIGSSATLATYGLLAPRHDTLPSIEAALLTWIQRRLAGEPVAYVTGLASFLGHDYRVGSGVLIPRQDTESWFGPWLSTLASARGQTPRRGFELGTGSGILALEIAAAMPSICMLAVDCSDEALVYAEQNRKLILTDSNQCRVEFRNVSSGDVFTEALDWVEQHAAGVPFDLIVSNPPYLVPGEATVEVEATEPGIALWMPGNDPLRGYEQLFGFTERCLNRASGVASFEIPHERSDALLALARARMSTREVDVLPDMTGRSRALTVRPLSFTK